MESEEKNIKFLKLKLYRAYVGYIACLGKIYFVNIVERFLKKTFTVQQFGIDTRPGKGVRLQLD